MCDYHVSLLTPKSGRFAHTPWLTFKDWDKLMLIKAALIGSSSKFARAFLNHVSLASLSSPTSTPSRSSWIVAMQTCPHELHAEPSFRRRSLSVSDWRGAPALLECDPPPSS